MAETGSKQEKKDAKDSNTSAAGSVAGGNSNNVMGGRERGAWEKIRKLAGLVLGQLADDPACCEGLSVYDGLIVQIMLGNHDEHAASTGQPGLTSLMHKLLLHIGAAATPLP